MYEGKEPIYLKANIKEVMQELVAKMSISHLVEVIEVPDNVIPFPVRNIDIPDQAA